MTLGIEAFAAWVLSARDGLLGMTARALGSNRFSLMFGIIGGVASRLRQAALPPELSSWVHGSSGQRSFRSAPDIQGQATRSIEWCLGRDLGGRSKATLHRTSPDREIPSECTAPNAVKGRKAGLREVRRRPICPNIEAT